MTDNGLIVVGVDGSESGRRALRWAVGEARHAGSAVRAVTAWEWGGADVSVVSATSPREEREHADRISLREVEAIVAEFGTSTPIAREVVEGATVPSLVEAARSARLLVLGSHGYSEAHRAVLGSTSEDCVRSARCPVVVVPVPPRGVAATTAPVAVTRQCVRQPARARQARVPARRTVLR